jgi:hypothetical protein
MYVGDVGPVQDNDSDYLVHIVLCRGKGTDPQNDDLDPENRVVGHLTVPLGTRQAKVVKQATGHLKKEMHKLIQEGDGHEELRVLQAVELQEPEWVWYRDYPMFGSIRHHGTTARWKAGSQQLVAAYIGVEQLPDVRDHTQLIKELWNETRSRIENRSNVEMLSDGQLEVLCDEYLRSNLDKHHGKIKSNIQEYQEYFHLQPVGGSQIAVDIIAHDAHKGRGILSQVTFESGATSKINDLLTYINNENISEFDLWYFGSNAHGDPELQSEFDDESVQLRSIEDIYRLMKKHRPTVVEELLSVPDPSTTSSPSVTAAVPQSTSN